MKRGDFLRSILPACGKFGLETFEIIFFGNCVISHFVRCEMQITHIRVSEHFILSGQIFHSVAISFAHRASFIKKAKSCDLAFFMVET